MNCGRQQDKPFRMMAAFVAVIVVFTLAGAAIPAQAQTYKVLYTFGTNSASDPIIPGSGPDFIAQGRDGNMYSTAWAGGTDNRGAAFKITPSGTETVLASFVFTNGLVPLGGLTLGTDGNLYGTSQQGGDLNCNQGFGCGTVFKITPGGALTTLFIFPADLSKGYYPYAAPTQGTDGNFYGTTGGNTGTVFKMTPTGTLTTLHTFNVTDGSSIASGLIQGTDGNFYGGSFGGGANLDGVVYKITPSGVFSVLHNFTGSDGNGSWSLIQAADGNFYGATVAGGTSNAGVVFKITPKGTYSVLHNLNGTTDGLNAYSSLVQATDGNFYGVTDKGGTLGYGTIYKITPQGAYSVVHNFDNTNGANPWSTLTQNTNGILYGDTFKGGKLTVCGTPGCGVVYSLNIGAPPFASLVSTSGKVGSKVGILGQGFSKSSVVKFGGVQAKSLTLTGTTFILATVPAGAVDGKVTVTTGASKLTSPQTFIVHNSWSSGAVLPTALQGPATGVIRGKVYVVGGGTNSGTVAINQIYNPSTNKWTTGASMPTARFGGASGVVNNILYVIGGTADGSTPLSVVEAYDPASNIWSTKASLPVATASASAAVENGIIYVVGGYANGQRTTNVESYNPVTDTWTGEAPLSVGKSGPAVGLLGSTIVAAAGYTNSGTTTGENEGYSATSNSWSALTSDPTPRQAGCAASVAGRLVFAGGTAGASGSPLKVVESFSASTNKWTTLASLPKAVIGPGAAEVNGLLYCFGGSNNGVLGQGTVYNYLQIYQP